MKDKNSHRLIPEKANKSHDNHKLEILLTYMTYQPFGSSHREYSLKQKFYVEKQRTKHTATMTDLKHANAQCPASYGRIRN